MIVFLGFELDTVLMVVRLPQDKRQQVQHLVQEWMGKRACKKRELEQLLRHLQNGNHCHVPSPMKASPRTVGRTEKSQTAGLFEAKTEQVRHDNLEVIRANFCGSNLRGADK